MLCGDRLVDLRFLYEGVQDVEDAIRAPHLHRSALDTRVEMQNEVHLAPIGEQRELVVRLRLDLRAPDAERLELVYELVHYVPEPLFGELERDGPV